MKRTFKQDLKLAIKSKGLTALIAEACAFPTLLAVIYVALIVTAEYLK